MWNDTLVLSRCHKQLGGRTLAKKPRNPGLDIELAEFRQILSVFFSLAALQHWHLKLGRFACSAEVLFYGYCLKEFWGHSFGQFEIILAHLLKL
jgi:hypothetical protein